MDKPIQRDRSRAGARLIQASSLIKATQARSQFNVTGGGLAVAVIDTGLRKSHVDFAGRVVAERNFTSSNGGDPYNAYDDHGHGTNVTGIIAANADHTGIAPGANIVALKVLDQNGAGSFTAIQNALQWVVDNHATYNITAVNMSLGDGGNHTTPPADAISGIIESLRDARVAVVVAAGNSFYEYQSKQGMGFPAIVAGSVSVGAVYDADQGSFTYGSGAKAFTTAADRLTPFSQRLHESKNSTSRTDIFAPGAPITSSGNLDDHGESTQHGTSQAGPVIAGAILLVQELYKREHGVLPPIDLIESVMRSSGAALNDGDDEDDNVNNTNLNYTRVDVLNALDAIHVAAVVTGPPTIVDQPHDQTVSEGQPATFGVMAGGAATLVYQWQRNGVDIAGATAGQYVTSGAISSDHAARFRCKISNAEGNAVSEEALLTVNPSGLIRLANAQGVSGSVAQREWIHYYIQVPADATNLTVSTSNAAADIDLYVRKGQMPTLNTWDFRPYLAMGNEEAIANGVTNPALSEGVWFCSVHGYQASSFTIVATHNGSNVNQPPFLVSNPSATPNPAEVDQAVSFSVAASDAEGDALTYEWSFGDGVTASGESTTHVFSAEGTYKVRVSISDGHAVTAGALDVTVNRKPDPLDVNSLRIKLNFQLQNHDACMLKANLSLPAGFNPEGATATLEVGGVAFPFSLDARGRSTSAVGSFGLKTKGLAGFSANLKNGSFRDLWSAFGMADEAAKNKTIVMPVKLKLVDGNGADLRYSGEKTLNYSAREGKGGIAR